MRKFTITLMFVLAIMVVVDGCAMTATSTQIQNLQTETRQIPMSYALDAIDSDVCRELSVQKIQGQAGISVGHDLQMLAEEIDSTVYFNGGNAYVVHDWLWITVDSYGSTAPLLRISVLDCPNPSATTA